MKRTALIFTAAMLILTACNNADTSVPEETSASAETVISAETSALTSSETFVTDALPETTLTENTETSASTASTTEAPIETVSSDKIEEKVCTCPNEWQHAYSEYLNGLDFLTGGVYLGDINGDDIPEAVIEINPYELTDILYFNDDGMQVLELWTTSVWGSVRYIPDTMQILFQSMRGHTWGTYGFTDYYLYGWNGSDFEVVSTLFRESGMYYIDEDETEHAELGQAYIDGAEVDNDTFEARLAEYQKLEQSNSYFPVAYICDYDYNQNPDMDSVKNYIKTNFPCFNKWELLEN
mgnify:CR=1 FL=1